MIETTVPSIESVQELFKATNFLVNVMPPRASYEEQQIALKRAYLALEAIAEQTHWIIWNP